MVKSTSATAPPFESSRDEGPYIFVSYAHADADAVYPELTWIRDLGYNIWYDEGIAPGHDWPEELATSIEQCALFLLFVTQKSIASDNCSREATFAVSRNRTILAIYLEEATLPSGLELSIGNSQAIVKHQIDSATYQRKLARALSQELGIEPDKVVGTTAPAKKSNLLLYSTIATIILGMAGILSMFMSQRDAGSDEMLQSLTAMIEQDTAIVGSNLTSTLDAYLLARRLEASGEYRAELDAFWPSISVTGHAKSVPETINISVKRSPEDSSWIEIGVSSQENFRFPMGQFIWKFSKPGFQDKVLFGDAMPLFTPAYGMQFPIKLIEDAEKELEIIPAGLTNPAATNYVAEPFIQVAEFKAGRYEVTNREFQAFVDAGGYKNLSYFEELMGDGIMLASFVDTTGRAGPATWELGSYPSGKADHPVGGISWYEAMAFARFSKASLPTIYHWAQAMLPYYASALAPMSNLNNQETISTRDDSVRGSLGLQGSFGNIREWVINAWDDRRWILGGGYSDPAYLSALPFSLPPEDRSPLNGLRLYYFDEPYPEMFAASRNPSFNDYRAIKPISEDTYSVIKDQYVDFGGALNAEIVYSSNEQDWRQEVIRIESDKEGETFDLNLYLPAQGEGPFQIVTYFPPISDFWGPGNSRQTDLRQRFLPLDMIARSGRVLAWPVYYGSFERYFGIYGMTPERRSQLQTEMRVHWFADLKRSLDYLETRSDMNINKLAYMGYSYGASHGLPLLALESRYKAAVLVGGGLGNLGIEPMPRAADPINFIPRITTPVMMINGKSDFVFPLESSQRPLFNLLGAAPEHKLKVEYEGDHYQLPATPVTRDIANWLDKYLGPTH